MVSHFIESLERRQFLSAAPIGTIHRSPATPEAVHVALHRDQKARGSSVPSGITGLYGGAYTIFPSDGYADLTVTSVRGNSFFGSVQFGGYDGARFSASVKATMSRNNNFKITLKGKGTSLVGTGTYYPDGNVNLSLFFNKGGKINGQKMAKYIPGEAAFIYGQDALNLLG